MKTALYIATILWTLAALVYGISWFVFGTKIPDVTIICQLISLSVCAIVEEIEEIKHRIS